MRQEDSIIFCLIERSQFKVNEAVYRPNCKELGEYKLHQLKSAGSNGCLGDYYLYQNRPPSRPRPSPPPRTRTDIASSWVIDPPVRVRKRKHGWHRTECLHSQARRYQHPTEKPFFGTPPT